MAKVAVYLSSIIFIRIDPKVDCLVTHAGKFQNFEFGADLIGAPLLARELLDRKVPRLLSTSRRTTRGVPRSGLSQTMSHLLLIPSRGGGVAFDLPPDGCRMSPQSSGNRVWLVSFTV